MIRKWFRRFFPADPPFSIRLTKLGGAFLLLCLVAAGAATNTGNNGLFIIASFLLSSLALSGVISKRNLWRVRGELEPLGEVFASETTAARISLSYQHARGAARSIRVETADSAAARLVTTIPSRRPQLVPLDVRFAQRGRRTPPAVLLSSRFPFGLFRKARRLQWSADVTVYPARMAIAPALIQRAGGGSGEEAAARRGRSPEVDGFRDFQAGDDPRDIHWKQSARQRRRILKQRASEGAGFTTIVVEAVGEEREALISAAASLAIELLALGRRVGIVSRSASIPATAGSRQRALILETLALLPPEDGWPPPALGPLAPFETRFDAHDILAAA